MLEAQNRTIEFAINSVLTPLREQWVGTDVVIPTGKYIGRKGQVTKVFFIDPHGICFQIQPYRMERAGNQTITHADLLWDHVDARKYWPVSRFEDLKVWNEST